MPDYKVEVRNVNKRFKETLALNDVSIEFERGKIHGIIGRNGSGKTVLLKCICGYMRPDSGDILIDKKRVVPSAAQDIGVIVEYPGFIDSMSGYQNLTMLAAIKGKISKQDVRRAIERVGLSPDLRKAVRKYSLGMRHRLGIAQAIMENPPLLILDEPMNGLDKQGVSEVREVFKSLSEEGCTIILTSHYVEDIEVLCHTVSEMDGGILQRIR